MESYSNWREELLIEVDEKDKGKKKNYRCNERKKYNHHQSRRQKSK